MATRRAARRRLDIESHVVSGRPTARPPASGRSRLSKSALQLLPPLARAGSAYDAAEAAYLRDPSNTYINYNMMMAGLLLGILGLTIAAWLGFSSWQKRRHVPLRGEPEF